MADKKDQCDHPEYVFDYDRKEHVCEKCRKLWRDTGKSYDTDNYVFDRLLGRI